MDSSENKIETFTATDHLNENSGGPLITVQINVIVIYAEDQAKYSMFTLV